MDTGYCTCWSSRRKTPLTFSSVYFLVFILSKICSESLALFKPNVSYLSTLPSHVKNENAETLFERWSNISDNKRDESEELKLYKSQPELRQPEDFEFDTPQLLFNNLDSNYVPVRARKSSDVLASSYKKRPWFHSWSGRKRNTIPTSIDDKAAQYLRFIVSKNPNRPTKIWSKNTAVNQESSEKNKISQMGKQGDALDSKHVLEKSSADGDQNMQTKPQHTIKISKWDNANKIADDDAIRLHSNGLKYTKGKVSNSRLKRSRQLTPGYEDFNVNLPPSSEYLSEDHLTQTLIRNTCLLLESSPFRLVANEHGTKCFLQPYKRLNLARQRHRPDYMFNRLTSSAVNVFYRTDQDNDPGNDKLANANINTNEPFQMLGTVSLGDDVNARQSLQLIDKDKDLSFEPNFHGTSDQRIFDFDSTLDQSGNERRAAYVQDCIDILSDPDCKDAIQEVKNIFFQRKVSIPLEELPKNIQLSEMLNKEHSNDVNLNRPNIGHKTTEGITFEATDKTGSEDSFLKELDNKLAEGKNTMNTDFLTVPENDDFNLKSTHLLSTKTLRDFVTNSNTFPVLQLHHLNENSQEANGNQASDLDVKSSEQMYSSSSSSLQDDLNDLQPFLQAYRNLLATKSARYPNPLSTDITDVSALHDNNQEGNSQQSFGHTPSNIQLLKSSPGNVKSQKEINDADVVSNMLYLNSYLVHDGSLKGKLHRLRKLDFDNNIQRSSLDSDLVDLIDKRPSFHSWSGKRNGLPTSEIDISKRPSFHSWSGKRNVDMLSKRPSFHSWSGKRNIDIISKRPSFHSWSGKRDVDMLSKRPSFHSWSGKRNLQSEIDISKRPSFHSWSGKRDEHVNGIRKRASFHSWSGKRNAFQNTLSKRPSFHSWSGKRNVDMLSKRPSFHSWSGKRNIDIMSKRPSFHSWSGKRDVDMLSKRPSFHSWSGKRNIDLMSKRPSFHSWSGKRDVDMLPKRPSFHSWSGKRNVDQNLI